ncbi:MAG: aldehyde dehydrogenase [Proteobacteria bacterium]|nr:aldehyde dehydrogenase [Pseudomonadota bacterium]
MNKPELGIADRQREFFYSRSVRNVEFRLEQLHVLKRIIIDHEARILEALNKDLQKPEAEAYTSEIAPVLHEIDLALKHLRSWSKPERVRTPRILYPGSSAIYREPYGSVLIIAPWNYPFQLAMIPLVGAMAAGNCAVLKPSEISSFTSRAMAEMIGASFDPSYVTVIEGGVDLTHQLLSQHFDCIFFTGSSRIGKIVMEAAAKYLTPVVLELGGKNPCIVDKDVDVEKTARRIVWGKYFNAGQTCLAPDYLLVHKAVKEKLIDAIRLTIERFYGNEPFQSPDYARIINQQHFVRLSALLKEGEIVVGGATDSTARYIAPTVIEKVSWNNNIMSEEIFGPLLPVLDYEDITEVIELLQRKSKPLALYFFSRNKQYQKRILSELSSGGVSINDTMAHIQNVCLPFGGVGESGMGEYHGKASFDVLSHKKAVLKRSFFADPQMKYPPYRTPLKYLKKVLKFLY